MEHVSWAEGNYMKWVMRATMHGAHMEDIINKSDDENVDVYSDAHHLGALPNWPYILST